MKMPTFPSLRTPLLALLVGWCGSCGGGHQASAQNSPAPGTVTVTPAQPIQQLAWPRQYAADGNAIVLYQPQIESWEGNKLEARAAVALTMKGQTQPTYGVVWMTARTDIDKSTRMVTLDQINVAKVSFPEHRESEAAYQALLNKAFPDTASDVPLDHLEANLAIANAGKKAAAVQVKNDPPKIIFSSQPAILILIDGKPVLRTVPQTQIMRVVNTRSLILLDASTQDYYLTLMNHWVISRSPVGPWLPADRVPPGFETLRTTLSADGSADLLVPNNPSGGPESFPVIYTSDAPAELIQSRGDPEYQPIEGTKLLYMKNSENAVFMMLGSQEYYVLVSGRWFRSASLQGPWTFVPGTALPADFARIPPDNAKANVLVSVPGTPQAEEAVIANSIPQTAQVNINEAKLSVSYDGGVPKFVAIPGTTLTYASNAALPVIAINESGNLTFWCVQNGIWFYSSTSAGPWVVARSVPPVIYTIPPACPIYYCTYVKIYGSSGNIVYVGYTPGYMGTCVAPDGVVVYGTGYYYPAYVGAVWYGYPPTYGYGAGFACGAATGFAFGFAAGAIIGDCWSRPYWGPCWGCGSIDINTHSVYGNWHGGVATYNHHYSYDAWTGKSVNQGGGRSFNPYTGRASVGGYSNYLDRADGDFDAKRGGASYNARTGTITAGGARASGNIYNGDVDVDRAGGKYNTRTGNGVGYKDGDVYASHDGNVYRHTDDGWQHHDSNGWQNNSGSGQNRDLDQQRSSRQVGQQRFNNFSGGGGRSGGGLRRR